MAPQLFLLAAVVLIGVAVTHSQEVYWNELPIPPVQLASQEQCSNCALGYGPYSYEYLYALYANAVRQYNYAYSIWLNAMNAAGYSYVPWPYTTGVTGNLYTPWENAGSGYDPVYAPQPGAIYNPGSLQPVESNTVNFPPSNDPMTNAGSSNTVSSTPNPSSDDTVTGAWGSGDVTRDRGSNAEHDATTSNPPSDNDKTDSNGSKGVHGSKHFSVKEQMHVSQTKTVAGDLSNERSIEKNRQ